MTRGGRAKTREGPERRCIASGERTSPTGMVRFVLGPEGDAVPDVAEKLPGRGAWLTADRRMVDKAVAKRLFARAFRAPVTAPADLADRIEALLAARLVERLALARKAGRAVTGFEKARARLESGEAGVLFTAADAAPDGAAKLAKLAPEVPRITLLGSAELGLAFGRDFAIHAALDKGGGFSKRILHEARRLGGFRGSDDGSGTEGRAARRSAPADGHANAGPQTGPGQDDE